MRKLLFLLFSLMVVSPLHAATHYFNASTGNDTTGDGSIGNQWQTFSKAYTECTAGDTCIFTGTYTTQLVPTASGTEGNHIIFQASGSGATLNGGFANLYAINANLKSYVTFDGFEITNWRGGGATSGAPGSGSVVNPGDAGTQVYFKNLNIHHVGSSPNDLNQYAENGINLSGTIDGLAENCTQQYIYATAAAYRVRGCTRPIIRGCSIRDFNSDGIHLYDSTDVLVETTVIRDHEGYGVQGVHPDGILLAGTLTNVTIRRSQIIDMTQAIYGPGITGGSVDTLTNIWIYGNIFWSEWYTNGTANSGTPGFYFDGSGGPYGSDADTLNGVYIVGNTFGTMALKALIVDVLNDTVTNVKFVNNLCYKTRGNTDNYAIDAAAHTGRLSAYNAFVTAYTPTWDNGTSLQDPSPINIVYTGYGFTGAVPSDFRPLEGTVLWDVGNTRGTGAPNLATTLGVSLPSGFCDWNGTARDGTYDTIGAWEFESGGSPPAATEPDPPTAVQVVNASPTQQNISWTAPASNGGSPITGYKIEVNIASAGWTTRVANTATTTTSYSATGLTSETNYAWRISAINAIGTSSASTSANDTTPAVGGGTVVAFSPPVTQNVRLFKNLAGQRLFIFVATEEGVALTGDAANITARISKDGQASVPLSQTNPTELSAVYHPGVYYFGLTTAETNADALIVSPSTTTSGVLVAQAIIYTERQQSGDGYAATVTYGSAIQAKTDLFTFSGSAVVSALADHGLDAVVVETGYNARQILSLTAATLFGEMSKSGNTFTFKAAGDNATTRVVGNQSGYTRSSLTLSPPL